MEGAPRALSHPHRCSFSPTARSSSWTRCAAAPCLSHRGALRARPCSASRAPSCAPAAGHALPTGRLPQREEDSLGTQHARAAAAAAAGGGDFRRGARRSGSTSSTWSLPMPRSPRSTGAPASMRRTCASSAPARARSDGRRRFRRINLETHRLTVEPVTRCSRARARPRALCTVPIQAARSFKPGEVYTQGGYVEFKQLTGWRNVLYMGDQIYADLGTARSSSGAKRVMCARTVRSGATAHRHVEDRCHHSGD
jgi:hypothetical protein